MALAALGETWRMAEFRREVDVAQFATVTQVRVAAMRVKGVSLDFRDFSDGLLWLVGTEESVILASEELLRIVAAGAESAA